MPLPSFQNLISLPDDSVPVTDADEEVFLLYTRLASAPLAEDEDDHKHAFHGLGFVDSHHDIINLSIPIPSLISASAAVGETTSGKKSGRKPKNRSISSKGSAERTIEIELFQDMTALRSRPGETGSVLWQASVVLAQIVLMQYHDHRLDVPHLFDRSKLATSHILELGAGIGLLSIILSPLAQRYTATDLEPLLPLIRKNIMHNLPPSKPSSPQGGSKHTHTPPNLNTNRRVSIESCDWIALHQTPESSRHRYFTLTNSDTVDLLIAVDCIYNPALVPPLVSTLNHYANPGHTAVLVMVELRAEDVISEFLDQWVKSGEWKIWRIGGDLFHPRYACWVGWKGVSEA
ncbi:hypothetical protein SISNIDRAFT_549120 [Sistotremastrum niveocremeum HHB9708]|uniref:Methyltransferase-domain-containing protein n=1 Tax=Sistotremastrum niveocremeum HHB9708 TaxID=1314777 RepID=A0A164VY07_9AGAM|nr:hypothetical protein SISNIDRAFT_549120 [Sistotremastrum niveocremeum HHB9708]